MKDYMYASIVCVLALIMEVYGILHVDDEFSLHFMYGVFIIGDILMVAITYLEWRYEK